MDNFSSLHRFDYIQKAENELFDLIVIGGGITGAGVALDAATRGLKVALIEKEDFASGTSSKSTKLIHGGLRYLKQLQFGVVHKTGVERAILYKNARHLVRPEPMLLPVIKGGSLGKFSTRIALWIYETLAGVPINERFKMLSPEATLLAEPLLDETRLLGSAVYTEYRTDDARLTISVIKTAVQKGATCLNYTELESLVYKDERVSGVKVIDKVGNRRFSIKATAVINAAGPWVDVVRNLDEKVSGKHLVLSKGVHVVVNYDKFPVKQSVYFDTPDKRMVFAIPRGKITYIGTTDTLHNAKPDEAKISKSDIDYLINACNALFSNVKLNTEDVISSWTGLRPLIGEEGKGTSELSRKDEVFVSQSGLISIAGGKLTGYRVMAETVINTLLRRSDFEQFKNVESQTKNLILLGGEFNDEKEIERFFEQQVGEAKQIGASPKLIADWVKRYGRETEKIVEYAFSLWPLTENKQLVPLLAELHFCIKEEAVYHPNDFWIRRTGKLFFEFPALQEEFESVFGEMSNLLNYSDQVKREFSYAFFAEMDAVKPNSEV